MNTRDPKLTALLFNECINNRDLEGLVNLMTDDHSLILSGHVGATDKASSREAWSSFFAMFSDYREFTPEERDILRELLSEDYRFFVQKVADGRGMEWEDVDAIARGRVWTGNQAAGNGLVDVLGGLSTAIEIARERAHISPAEDVEVVVLPVKGGLFGGIFCP